MKWWETPSHVGAVVELKSGGFPMTIEAVSDGHADCVWADKGRIRRDRFAIEVLKPSRDGADLTLIIEGLNATSDEVAEFKKVSGNA